MRKLKGFRWLLMAVLIFALVGCATLRERDRTEANRVFVAAGRLNLVGKDEAEVVRLLGMPSKVSRSVSNYGLTEWWEYSYYRKTAGWERALSSPAGFEIEHFTVTIVNRVVSSVHSF